VKNLEQSSAEKVGINPTYQAPLQELRSCAAIVKHTFIESLLRAGSRDSQIDCLSTFFAGL
jgi:hypothetical protein